MVNYTIYTNLVRIEDKRSTHFVDLGDFIDACVSISQEPSKVRSDKATVITFNQGSETKSFTLEGEEESLEQVKDMIHKILSCKELAIVRHERKS